MFFSVNYDGVMKSHGLFYVVSFILSLIFLISIFWEKKKFQVEVQSVGFFLERGRIWRENFWSKFFSKSYILRGRKLIWILKKALSFYRKNEHSFYICSYSAKISHMSEGTSLIKVREIFLKVYYFFHFFQFLVTFLVLTAHRDFEEVQMTT